jgi:DNA repair exonuclease SbcCD ATPase subunit
MGKPKMTDPLEGASNTACPVCNTDLGGVEKIDRVKKELEKTIDRRIRDSTRAQALEHASAIKELKKSHRVQIQQLKKKYSDQQRELKAKLNSDATKQRSSFKTALAKMKKTQQMQMSNLRDAYDRENLRLQKEKESNFNVQLQALIHDYGNLASGHQKELERLKKAHDQSHVLVRKKDSEIARLKIELAKSSSRLEVKELMLKLHERDETIERLSLRIQELEGKSAPQARPVPAKKPQKSLTEDEQREKLKEYMRAIIEITRSQQAEKKKAELPSQNDENMKQELGESKVDKKLGWFF